MFNKFCNSSVLIGYKSFTRSPNFRSCATEGLKQQLNVAAKDFNFTQMSDWYKITNEVFPNVSYHISNVKDLESKLGPNITQKYNKSPYQLLSSAYPDYKWLPWKFNKCHRGFWDKLVNQRQFLEWVAQELNIKEMSDWYKVGSSDVASLGGRNLLKLNAESVPQILSVVYPEYEWLPWKFEKSPRNYWSDIENQKKFIDWAGKELKIKELSDWYNEILKLGGAGLLKLYSGSLIKCLSTVYPAYTWLIWKFSKCPQHFWDNIKNQREYMNWVAKELNIKDMSGWYNVSENDIINMYGRGILLRYDRSISQLLSSLYPGYEWLPWKFPKGVKGMNLKNPKVFMENLAKDLGIKELSDWYNIKEEQLIEMGGGVLLIQYHSLFQLLSSIYPEFSWNLELFSSQEKDIWINDRLVLVFIEWLKKQPESVVSYLQELVIQDSYNSGTFPLTQHLKSAFPKYKWLNSWLKSAKKSQYMLKECISKIFANRDALLLEEYKHPDIELLELDLFMPQYNLAFEYQGQQHYRTNAIFHTKESVDVSKQRDKHKHEACKELGITMIEVPYWWDRKISSLEATIYNARPDLFTEKPKGTPISITIPSNIEIVNDKSKTSKEYLMTATEWDNSTMDPTGWMMTEKYDGMRLYWTGSQFLTRQRKKFKVPESMTRQLPVVALDGELWTQYGLHQEAVGLGNSTNEEKWSKAIYWVFDSPQLENKPLEERIEFIRNLSLPSFAKVVEFAKCENKDHLKQFNDSIIAKGGEGVMLREPGSIYKSGRSTSMRKFKPFFDTEVKVVNNQYPYGFMCEQLNGKALFVNITNENLEAAKTIKVGSVITVKHSGMNVHGTLMYPQFYRERVDVQWSDLNKTL